MTVLLSVASAPITGTWVTPEDLDACDPPAGVDIALVCNATAERLGLLSFGVFGLIADTVRPMQVGMCRCYEQSAPVGCGCAGRRFIELDGPVVSIEEVTIDGAVLDPSAYATVDRLWLVRRDGNDWPCCNDLTVPSGEPGTWTVAYTWGNPVTYDAQVAARVYACELAKALADRDCQLSGRVQTVNRDGVNAVIVDNQGFLADGMTGVTVTDGWLHSLRRTTPPGAGRMSAPGRTPRLAREQ